MILPFISRSLLQQRSNQWQDNGSGRFVAPIDEHRAEQGFQSVCKQARLIPAAAAGFTAVSSLARGA